MEERLNVLPDERFAATRAALRERLDAAAALISAQNCATFLDPVMRSALLEVFGKTGAHEGTLWLIDAPRENLVAAFNSGPHAAQIAGSFTQPLSAGMIALVVASEQPLCENRVYQNARQDKTLDRKLGFDTCAMIAVPFYFSNKLRGVLSCVRLKPSDSAEDEPPGFLPEDLDALWFTATLLGRLIDHRLLTLTLDLDNP